MTLPAGEQSAVALRVHALHAAHLPEMTDMMLAALQVMYPAAMAEHWRVRVVDAVIASRDNGVPWTVLFDATGTMTACFATAAAAGESALFVSPRVWGTAWAAQTLARQLAGAKGPITLPVARANARALRFFQKAGFTPQGDTLSPWTGAPALRLQSP